MTITKNSDTIKIVKKGKDLSNMKKDIRRESLGLDTDTTITTETYRYFRSREEMHSAVKEAMYKTEYPEIILDTWNHIIVNLSGFEMGKTELGNFVLVPTWDDSEKEDT